MGLEMGAVHMAAVVGGCIDSLGWHWSGIFFLPCTKRYTKHLWGLFLKLKTVFRLDRHLLVREP